MSLNKHARAYVTKTRKIILYTFVCVNREREREGLRSGPAAGGKNKKRRREARRKGARRRLGEEHGR